MILYTPRRQKTFSKNFFKKRFLRRHGDRSYTPSATFCQFTTQKKSDVYCSVLLFFCFCSICHLLFCIVPFFVCFLSPATSYTPFLCRRRQTKKFFENVFCEKIKSLIYVFLRFRFLFFCFLLSLFSNQKTFLCRRGVYKITLIIPGEYSLTWDALKRYAYQCRFIF